MELSEEELADARLIGTLSAMVFGLAVEITVDMRHGRALDERDILRRVAEMEQAFANRGHGTSALLTPHATEYLATLEPKETP